MKACTKCGETKPRNEFHKDKRSKDGLCHRCKACVKAYKAEWYERPEVQAHIAAWGAEYYRRNRDAVLARVAEYHSRPEVKAHRAEYQAEYHQANPHVWWVGEYQRRAKKYGFVPVVEPFTKDELVARWGDACWHCGGPFEELDHWPLSVRDGGRHSLESCRPSCGPCNRRSWGKSFTA